MTLCLAYAERDPDGAALVLAAVTLTRPADIRWLYHETGRFFPDEWQRFRAGAAAAGPAGAPPDGEGLAGDLVAAYHRLLHEQPDGAVRARAAQAWCAWEDAVQSLEPDWAPDPRYADPAFRMTFARIVTHYFQHRAWLADGQLRGRPAASPASPAS